MKGEPLVQAGSNAGPTPSRPPREARGADLRAPFGDTIARAMREARPADAPPGAPPGPKADGGDESASAKDPASRDGRDETPAPDEGAGTATNPAATAPGPAAATPGAPAALPACAAAAAAAHATPAGGRDTARPAGEDAAIEAALAPAPGQDAHEGAARPGTHVRSGPAAAAMAAAGRAVPGTAAGDEPATEATPGAAAHTQQAGESRGEHPGARAATDFPAQLAQARGATLGHAAQAPPGATGAHAPYDEGIAAAARLASTSLATPVGAPAFPAHLAAEVATIGLAGVEHAQIELRPRELGPVRVELSMSGEAARIAFSAAHPDTRQAIEQSLPILKDLLAERGLMLAGASVSDGGAGSGRAATGDGAPHRHGEPARESRGAPATTAPRLAAARRALLDVYA